jgi:hypothetical protein
MVNRKIAVAEDFKRNGSLFTASPWKIRFEYNNIALRLQGLCLLPKRRFPKISGIKTIDNAGFAKKKRRGKFRPGDARATQKFSCRSSAQGARSGGVGATAVLSSLWRKSTWLKNFPQGLKPTLYFLHLPARLKPCPFKTWL